jgi:hypothetical protein
MKKLDLMLAVLVLCAGARVSAQEQEAISNYGQGGFPDFAAGGAGFGFRPVVNISVTSLGYWQSGFSDYSRESGTVQVSIWDSTGDLLSTALITGTDPTFDQTCYQTISPLTLYAGKTYFIGGVEPDLGAWAGDWTVKGFSASPDITYLGVATGANMWEELRDHTLGDLAAGVNFQFTVVPEPSTLALGGLGIATLALFARKPSQ